MDLGNGFQFGHPSTSILNSDKGKNFSANNLGQRKKSDAYFTPYSLTSQFLDVANIPKEYKILEPACGNGAITKVLMENGYTDIVSYDKEKDFLSEPKINYFDYILTNPPFSLAQEFILQAKRVAKIGFSFLLPLSYLHGKKRYDEIWTDTIFPLSEIHVFTRYPMLGESLRSDGCYSTGMLVYAWFTFIRGYEGKPEINWIDNNSYVVGKKDK